MTRNDTVSEWSKIWLEAKAPALEPSTIKAYTSAVNFWTRKLGNKLLRDVMPIHIQSAYASDAPESGKTRNNYLSVLNGIFDSAFFNRLIDSRPTDYIENFAYQKPEPDPFTKEEVERVLAYMSDTYNDQVGHYFDFALMTGIRPSEMIALEWSDVDFTRKTVTVRRAHVASQTKGTKTGLVRNVIMSDRALVVLQRQKPHTFIAGKAIFHNPVTNRAWSDDKQQREKYFAPTLKALGLRGRDAYQCRHTYATLLLTAGVHVGYISKQLGHTTIKTTLDSYARFLPDAYAAETEKANAVFAPVLPPKIAKSA
jgi:integrase